MSACIFAQLAADKKNYGPGTKMNALYDSASIADFLRGVAARLQTRGYTLTSITKLKAVVLGATVAGTLSPINKNTKPST